MKFTSVKALGLGCVALGATALTTVDANAGAFAIREQSATGQGSSFAGVAAGGSLSSMFWNPAIITQFAGKTWEGDISTIFPHSGQTGASALGTTGQDNTGLAALVPSSYSSWQLNDSVWLGLATNAPFGLGVNTAQLWAGAGYAQNAAVQSLNINPVIAYRISNTFSVALGFQAQYMKISYDQFQAVGSDFNIGGRGWAYGFTAGATWTPTRSTQVGIGYRSALDQKISGDLTNFLAVGAANGPITATLKLPDMVTVGLRQGLNDRWTLLAGFEWSHWSRIGTTTIPTNSALVTLSLPFQYSDGYLYSLGAEYKAMENLTLRGGIAFEKSPITDAVRTPRLPDNDRWWYSVGASYKPSDMKGVTLDVGYSYINVKSTPITITAASGNPWLNATGPFTGNATSFIHILSFGVSYHWDEPETHKVRVVAK